MKLDPYNLKFDPIFHPESTRFEAWLAAERAKGLVDFKVSLANPPLPATYEAFEKLAAEINRAIAAPTLSPLSLD